jgi:two-component system, LytTR family, response regulator
MAFTCIIADDEDLAIALLQKYAAQIPELQVLHTFCNGKAVQDYLQTHKPDILLLDIQMPGLTGLELAAEYASQCAIIFTTAYHEHAAASYTLSVVDYLLKPFLPERFQQAIKKATDYITYKKQVENSTEAAYIFVKCDYRLEKILLSDILFLEGRKQYVRIQTTVASYMVLDSMKNFESMLPANRFLRVHKSYIIGLDKVKTVAADEVVIDKNTIPVSKTHREALLQRLGS